MAKRTNKVSVEQKRTRTAPRTGGVRKPSKTQRGMGPQPEYALTAEDKAKLDHSLLMYEIEDLMSTIKYLTQRVEKLYKDSM